MWHVQAVGGVLASIASIITLWLGSGPVQIGFSYFLTALVITLISILVFFILTRLVSLHISHEPLQFVCKDPESSTYCGL